MGQKLFSLRQVEIATTLSRSTLYRRLREGRLRGIRLDNGQWRIPEDEVLKILNGPLANAKEPTDAQTG